MARSTTRRKTYDVIGISGRITGNVVTGGLQGIIMIASKARSRFQEMRGGYIHWRRHRVWRWQYGDLQQNIERLTRLSCWAAAA